MRFSRALLSWRMKADHGEDIDRDAGFGGHGIRCWIAACAAMAELGGPRPGLDYYRLVPEWITGMRLMTAEQT